MRIEFAEQYSRPCVVLGDMPGDRALTYEDVKTKAIEAEAIYYDGEDLCYVVSFPGGGFPELYTDRALRGSVWMRDGL